MELKDARRNGQTASARTLKNQSPGRAGFHPCGQCLSKLRARHFNYGHANGPPGGNPAGSGIRGAL